MRFFLQSAGLLFTSGVLLTSTMRAQSRAIVPSSGKQLCAVLTPADFTKAGVPVSAQRDANVDDSASAYCVYDSNVGKVEFDIFYPAGDTPEAAKGTEKTVLAEVRGKFENIKLRGADSASINLAVPGKQPSASIAARWKTAVFTIGIPAGPNARAQLSTLCQTVLLRLQHE
jgi:hypothetical protein